MQASVESPYTLLSRHPGIHCITNNTFNQIRKVLLENIVFTCCWGVSRVIKFWHYTKIGLNIWTPLHDYVNLLCLDDLFFGNTCSLFGNKMHCVKSSNNLVKSHTTSPNPTLFCQSLPSLKDMPADRLEGRPILSLSSWGDSLCLHQHLTGEPGG